MIVGNVGVISADTIGIQGKVWIFVLWGTVHGALTSFTAMAGLMKP